MKNYLIRSKFNTLEDTYGFSCITSFNYSEQHPPSKNLITSYELILQYLITNVSYCKCFGSYILIPLRTVLLVEWHIQHVYTHKLSFSIFIQTHIHENHEAQ